MKGFVRGNKCKPRVAARQNCPSLFFVIFTPYHSQCLQVLKLNNEFAKNAKQQLGKRTQMKCKLFHVSQKI